MLIDQLADVEENPRALASRIFEPRQAFARGGILPICHIWQMG